MYLTVRLPMACLLIVLYMLIVYVRRKRLRTKVSVVFILMMAFGAAHTALAAITEHGVNNRDKISPFLNLAFHTLFIFSISIWCTLLCDYLLFFIERTLMKGRKKERLMLHSVLVLCLIGELLLPITYIDTPEGAYSYGPKAYVLYVNVVFSMILMVAEIIRHRREIGGKISSCFISSCLFFIAFAAVQIFFPHILLTDLAVTMILLNFLLNAEDSNLYVDGATGLYNGDAFSEMLRELKAEGKGFSVAAISFLGSDDGVLKAMSRIEGILNERRDRLFSASLSGPVLAAIPYTSRPSYEIKDADIPSMDLLFPDMPIRLDILQFPSDVEIERVFGDISKCRERFEAESVYKDELTGVMRRAQFSKITERLIAEGSSFTFLMIDVDDFKSVNSRFGHAVGDKAIKGVADSLVRTLRSTDYVCRIGGDEFAAILFGVTERSLVEEIFRRICFSLERFDALFEQNERITISVGARIHMPSERSVSFIDLYESADSALYMAKNSGKNRVVVI